MNSYFASSNTRWHLDILHVCSCCLIHICIRLDDIFMLWKKGRRRQYIVLKFCKVNWKSLIFIFEFFHLIDLCVLSTISMYVHTMYLLGMHIMCDVNQHTYRDTCTFQIYLCTWNPWIKDFYKLFSRCSAYWTVPTVFVVFWNARST